MILAERFDGGSVDVSAVDTGLPVGSTPRDLGAGAGRAVLLWPAAPVSETP
mgnify:FL=1